MRTWWATDNFGMYFSLSAPILPDTWSSLPLASAGKQTGRAAFEKKGVPHLQRDPLGHLENSNLDQC